MSIGTTQMMCAHLNHVDCGCCCWHGQLFCIAADIAQHSSSTQTV